MSHAALVESFSKTVWLGGDETAALDYFHPDACATGLGSDMTFDPRDFVTYVQSIRMLISVPTMKVMHVVENDDWIALHVRCHALSRISGAEIDFTGQLMVRVQDGKIAEAYNHFDMVAFFVQMGFVPEDVVEKMLAGYAPA
jgi:hypothetical protein